MSELYRETEDDLTHAADAIRGLKVVAKTASSRNAGLADAALAVKEWLAGRIDPMVKRIINFSGDIARWLKGFKARTDMVKKSTDRLQDALKEARTSIDKVLA